MKTKAISTLKGGVLKWRPMAAKGVWNMNFNQYTKKSLEAVQSAQSLAVEHHHQQMEQLHLLLALLQQEGGLAPQILRKLGVTVESLEAAAQAELDKLPRVSGSREADKFYISQGVDDVLQLAERLAASMKDEYVSVEHFLLALVEAAQGPVKELLGTIAFPRRTVSRPFRPSGATSGSPLTARRIPMRPWKSTARTWCAGPGRKRWTRSLAGMRRSGM